MGNAAKKLHSQRGASILMALVFFLVCGFVGAVILGAATTDAQKLQGRRAEQQAYYSVSSAARLIRDTLEGMTLQGEEHWTEYTCNDPGSPADDPHEDEKKVDSFRGTEHFDGQLAQLMLEGAQKVYLSQTVYTPRKPFTGWSRTFTVDDGIQPVTGVVTIREDYQLTVTLQTAEDLHAMTLVCPAGTPQMALRDSGGSCSHRYWVDSVYDYGGGEWVTEQFPFTVHTRTTTVTWGRGSITKGVTDHG